MKPTHAMQSQGGSFAVRWARRVSLLAICLAVAIQGSAFAQTTRTWVGGSGSWTVGSNWSGGVLPGTGTTADINGAPGTVVNVMSGSAGPTGMPIIVRAGNTLLGTGTNTNSATQRLGTGASVTNAGIIENALLFTGTVTNSGTIRASGAGKYMAFATPTISNTNALLSATSGGILNFNNSIVNGGTISIDALSLFQNVTSGSASISNATVTNSGTTLIDYFDAANTRTNSIGLNGTTTFDNFGTTTIRFSPQAPSGTAGSSKSASMVVSSTSTFTNRSGGVLNIAMLQGSNTNSFVLSSFFQMNASGFNNQGAINITTSATSVGTAQFRTGTVGFSNAGGITVDGPKSSIEMNTRTYTQSAGSLSLINGGQMTAGSVLINSGTLLGTGTVNAPVTIGGVLAPGSGGIGTLSVTNGVTWNAGNAWSFDLGTAAASLSDASTGGSTGDLLGLTGAFTKGTGSTFTFDFANSGSDGWYKIVDYTSTTFTSGTNNNGFQATNLPAGKSANFVVDASSTALYVQIVPEPGTLALAGIGLGLAGLALSRRRRA